MAAPFQWSLAALETLMAEDQMDQHAAVLRAFSVVELWRLRRVCRAFHRWGTAALAALPRVVAVGGQDASYDATAGVEVLDLSTLRWSSGVVPDLPEPRGYHSVCCCGLPQEDSSVSHLDVSIFRVASMMPHFSSLPSTASNSQVRVTTWWLLSW